MTDETLLSLAVRSRKNHSDMKDMFLPPLRRVLSLLIAFKAMKEAVNAGDVLWPNSTKTVLEISTSRYATWKNKLATILPKWYNLITLHTVQVISNAVSISWTKQQLRPLYGMMIMENMYRKNKTRRQALRKLIGFRGEMAAIPLHIERPVKQKNNPMATTDDSDSWG